MNNPPITAFLIRSALILTLIGPYLSGCASTSERLHPQFAGYRQAMGVLLVLEPEIGIFELMSDGSRLYQENLSRQAQRHAWQCIGRELQARRFSVLTADDRTLEQSEIKDIKTLFRSVNRSIQLHTFGPQRFPDKISAFEYQLGPVADVLKANGADALVLTLGHQTGLDPAVVHWLSVAVVDPEGRIIWYGLQGGPRPLNLHYAEGMKTLIDSTMANFWERGL